KGRIEANRRPNFPLFIIVIGRFRWTGGVFIFVEIVFKLNFDTGRSWVGFWFGFGFGFRIRSVIVDFVFG
ncbi:hypothetical protein A2U01_0070835, partial [Trifolium medium]|nr:hypothetical protein [Trifolium medium]